MRPLRLELSGFTSFREPTRVSFEDAELFVLTGATGSGKSSLIDAMVFALYGAVSRYDKQNVVAPVISQGKVEARVRLDFEVGGREYSAVRIVRRTQSGASTKEAVLERKVKGGEAKILAGTAPELSQRIENDVIGLGFDHFTKCVVLPQGEFATFMRAKPSVRQKLLERLLGLELYDRLLKEANRRASDRDSRVHALAMRLADLAGATAQAVREAEGRVAALEALGAVIGKTEAAMRSVAEAADDAAGAAAEAERRRVLLAGTGAPPGAEESSRRHGAAAAAAASAEARLEEAGVRRREAAGTLEKLPERSYLRAVADRRDELARCRGELQRIAKEIAAAERTLAELAEATPEAVEEAEAKAAALETLASRIREAVAGLAAVAETERDARRRVGEARQLAAALAGVTAPDGAEELAARHGKAATAARSAADALEAAGRRREEARARRDALPERAKLERILDEWTGLARMEESVGELGAEAEAAQKALDAAAERERAAAERVEAAESDRDALRDEHGADHLARGLEVGEPCPVCLQDVEELPRRDPPAGLEGAEAALAAAESARSEARAVRRDRERSRDEAAVRLRGREEAAAELRERLRAGVGREDARAGIAAIEGADLAAQLAVAAVDVARGGAEAASSALAALESEMDAAWEQYGEARDAVAALGPPKADQDDLGGSWRALSAWAVRRAGELEGEAAAAQADADAQRTRHERDSAELRGSCRARGVEVAEDEDPAGRCAEAQVAAREAVVRAEAGVKERRRAADSLDQARRRKSDRTDAARALEEFLADAPGPDKVAALLDAIAAAQRDLSAADAAESEARSVRAAAAEKLADAEAEMRAAWRQFRAERDRLAEMKPPPAVDGDLVGSWKAIVDWCDRLAAGLAAEAAAAWAEKHAREEELGGLAVRLRERCIEGGLEVGSGQSPSTRCAEALGSARGDLGHLRAAAEERARVEEDAAEARRQAEVARDLGRHLSAHGFRRWLQNQVLKWLVKGATARLRELSSGQYSLALDDRNEFQVVDHRNADELRPAKTLSGGETFLASLALALSLAEQVAGLAARGSPRLEALFLDEGFGALDPETLDVVAASIDQLGADRMVGLVTHVSELANRIPVQYRVRKVGNSSSVERVET